MSKLIIYKIDLNEAAEKALIPVLNESWPVIKRQINDGICELFRDDNGGYMVTRIEVMPEYETLVIVAATGAGMVPMLEAFREYCELNGIKYMRCHSDKPGVWRMYERAGLFELERVYQVECV